MMRGAREQNRCCTTRGERREWKEGVSGTSTFPESAVEEVLREPHVPGSELVPYIRIPLPSFLSLSLSCSPILRET